MKILILEDDYHRHEVFKSKLSDHDLRITDSSKECIALLNTQHWDILFLDHDLGGKTFVQSGEDTGYEVANWLSKHQNKIPKTVYIHSMNPAGSKNMKDALPDAHVVPFALIQWEN